MTYIKILVISRPATLFVLKEKKMDLHLDNKVFIVTGGSKGIGEEITRTIIDEGGIVVIASRSEMETGKLVKQLNSDWRLPWCPRDFLVRVSVSGAISAARYGAACRVGPPAVASRCASQGPPPLPSVAAALLAVLASLRGAS